MMRVLAIAAVMLLGGCVMPQVDHARLYPLNDVATRLGVPQIEYVRRGTGNGPVTVTMPNGEILRGEFQVTRNETVGVGFFGARSTTAISAGTSSGVMSAIGDRGTVINCDGVLDIGGHGSGACEISQGARYRVMY